MTVAVYVGIKTVFRTSITSGSSYSDVISSVVVDPTGLKFRVKFGDSRSNRFRDI